MKKLLKLLSVGALLSTNILANGSDQSNKEIAEKLAAAARTTFAVPMKMMDRGNLINVDRKILDNLADYVLMNLKTVNGQICTDKFFYHNSDASPLVPFTVCLDQETNRAYSPLKVDHVSYSITSHIFEKEASFSSSLSRDDLWVTGSKSRYIFDEIQGKVKAGMRVDKDGICTDLKRYQTSTNLRTYCVLDQFYGVVQKK